ncbi:MAG: hypothetical protein M1818_000790 [Claussenomyces sp. TS43310]|nr:MAG: hypothetical protein M1818_000790 [Claussenomyces sp. TS43310]
MPMFMFLQLHLYAVALAYMATLPHRHKASIIRKSTAAAEELAEDGNSDLSSDEEYDAIDSDDVDSDDLDGEFLGGDDGTIDPDITMQQDYVQL